MFSKVPYFFFSRKSSWVIHSFKIENRVFFFPKKKYKLVFFFFPGKVHTPFIQYLVKPNVFFNKMGCIFFFPHFRVFFSFFFFLEKFTCHSFIRLKKLFFFFPVSEKKKNSFFIHSFGFAQKCVKNELFRGKKNTVPLVFLILN